MLPADGSREALMRLIETVARPLGLTDTELRALRLIVTACRWADFVDPSRDPVCFRQQQRMAEALGVTAGHFRRIEAKLERLGLIERATCENGHRGRLGPRGSDGAGGPVAGLSLAPLLANVPRWQAMAEAVAREATALAEGRAMIRIERRAARHAALALAPGHPARAAYEALRGAAFPRSAGYTAQAAITAHLETLRGVIEEARAAAPEAPADEPIMAGLDGQDDALMHGAPCAQERRHTENTTDPQTGSCSEAAQTDAEREAGDAAMKPTGLKGREEGRPARERPVRPAGPTDAKAHAAGEVERRSTTRNRAEDGEDDTAQTPPTSLPPTLARRLTPRTLRAMACEELRLYIDHLDPHEGPPTLRDVEHAALMRRRDLGIAPEAWDEAETSLGWLDALVALIVVDRNRTHPTIPVRNPGGLLRTLARRRRAGTLDLAASVMGVWKREEDAVRARPR